MYCVENMLFVFFFFFQAEDGIRDYKVTGVQTCALPIWPEPRIRTLACWVEDMDAVLEKGARRQPACRKKRYIGNSCGVSLRSQVPVAIWINGQIGRAHV